MNTVIAKCVDPIEAYDAISARSLALEQGSSGVQDTTAFGGLHERCLPPSLVWLHLGWY